MRLPSTGARTLCSTIIEGENPLASAPGRSKVSCVNGSAMHAHSCLATLTRFGTPRIHSSSPVPGFTEITGTDNGNDRPLASAAEKSILESGLGLSIALSSHSSMITRRKSEFQWEARPADKMKSSIASPTKTGDCTLLGLDCSRNVINQLATTYPKDLIILAIALMGTSLFPHQSIGSFILFTRQIGPPGD